MTTWDQTLNLDEVIDRWRHYRRVLDEATADPDPTAPLTNVAAVLKAVTATADDVPELVAALRRATVGVGDG